KRKTVRDRCSYLDPRRADRLRNPAVRLYAEYIWGYVSAIQRAPLSPEDQRECYRILARWMASRAFPVAGRTLSRSGLSRQPLAPPASLRRSVSAVVAPQRVRGPMTARGRTGGKPLSPFPRVGLFGKLGAGNIGNDASMESVLSYLRDHQPQA